MLSDNFKQPQNHQRYAILFIETLTMPRIYFLHDMKKANFRTHEIENPHHMFLRKPMKRKLTNLFIKAECNQHECQAQLQEKTVLSKLSCKCHSASRALDVQKTRRIMTVPQPA